MQIKQLILQTSALKELTDFYIKLMELPVALSGEGEIKINHHCRYSKLLVTMKNCCYCFGKPELVSGY
jgi:hypothetical protein